MSSWRDRRTQADRLFREIVRRTRGPWCERCGTEPATDVAHIIPRRFTATRCDPLNAWVLCRACHEVTEPNGAARDLLVAMTIGTERLAELETKARELVPDLTSFWAETVDRLRKELGQ